MADCICNWPGKGLQIGDVFVPVPIVQGGMGIGVSGHRLAAAVANQGGIGVISSVGLGYMGFRQEVEAKADEHRNVTFFRQELQKAREQSKNAKGALGVNIMVAIREFDEMASAAIAEGIDFIFAGAGLPLTLPSLLTEGAKTKLVPIVSSAKAARLIAKRWMSKYHYAPDAFVLEGPKAGGHLGFSLDEIFHPDFQLEKLLPPLVEEVRKIELEAGKRIPIIAGGGIFTGEDIGRILELGADGVQMATRFVATEECDADIAFKNAYVQCKAEDITIIQSPVGLPGRAIGNEFLAKVKEGSKKPKVCSRHCITSCKETESPYCISSALLNAVHGNLDEGFAFVGANGHRIETITTVPKLICELAAGYGDYMESGRDK